MCIFSMRVFILVHVCACVCARVCVSVRAQCEMHFIGAGREKWKTSIEFIIIRLNVYNCMSARAVICVTKKGVVRHLNECEGIAETDYTHRPNHILSFSHCHSILDKCVRTNATNIACAFRYPAKIIIHEVEDAWQMDVKNIYNNKY